MNVVDSMEQTSADLVAHGRLMGVELSPLLRDLLFENGSRWVYFWREDSRIRYNMQGPAGGHLDRIGQVATTGSWHEVGTVGTMEQALALISAWLLKRAEVDELPARCPEEQGIG